MNYISIYKCRMCGKTFEKSVTSNKNIVVATIIQTNLQKPVISNSPHLIDVHHCENGDIACADFVGWKKEGAEE